MKKKLAIIGVNGFQNSLKEYKNIKRIIIFGTNKLSEIIFFHLSRENENLISCFTVDDEYCTDDVFMNKKVVPFSRIKEFYPPEENNIIMTIGYSNMNMLRKEKFMQCKNMGYEMQNYINEKSVCFCENMGTGNIILENCCIGPFTKMGDGNIIYPSTTISHHSEMGNFNFFSVECAIAGNVKIGNNCFFGANCTIKNDIKLADYCLIGAGAYISADTDEKGVYVPPRSCKLEGKESLQFKI